LIEKLTLLIINKVNNLVIIMEINRNKLMTLIPLIQQLSIKVGVERTKTGRENGFTNLNMAAIQIIQKNKNVTMSTLAKELMILPPAATRIVNDLIRKKLIRRETDPSDRRIIRLSIDPQAYEIFTRVPNEVMNVFTRVLSLMKENESDALILGLEAFVKAVLIVEQEDAANK
jgi:DNA-binding MarR family transcriptional regulator